MSQTAAHLVDHVIPRVPVRQWVLSLPIPLRLLLAAQPKLVTPVLQVVHRVITRFLLKQAGVKTDEADSGAVTLIQRFGSAANLNIHLHCLVLDGVYRCDADGAPVFVEAGEPTDDELHALLDGHTTVVVGHSGVGKSTLVNAIAPGVAEFAGYNTPFDARFVDAFHARNERPMSEFFNMRLPPQFDALAIAEKIRESIGQAELGR